MVKTMNLTVRERLLMGVFFPDKGTMKDMRITKDLSRKLILTDEDKAEIGFVKDGDSIRWEKQKDMELELNDDEREFLKRQVRRIDDEAAVTQDIYELAERIKEL